MFFVAAGASLAWAADPVGTTASGTPQIDMSNLDPLSFLAELGIDVSVMAGDPSAAPSADPAVDPAVDPTGDVPNVDEIIGGFGIDPSVDPTDPSVDPTVDQVDDPVVDPDDDPAIDTTVNDDTSDQPVACHHKADNNVDDTTSNPIVDDSVVTPVSYTHLTLPT